MRIDARRASTRLDSFGLDAQQRNAAGADTNLRTTKGLTQGQKAYVKHPREVEAQKKKDAAAAKKLS